MPTPAAYPWPDWSITNKDAYCQEPSHDEGDAPYTWPPNLISLAVSTVDVTTD